MTVDFASRCVAVVFVLAISLTHLAVLIQALWIWKDRKPIDPDNADPFDDVIPSVWG